MVLSTLVKYTGSQKTNLYQRVAGTASNFLKGCFVAGGIFLMAHIGSANAQENLENKLQPALLVQGKIHKDNKIELDRWDPLGKQQPDESRPGNYSIECIDAVGKVLNSYSFGIDWSDWLTSGGSAGFAFAVPYPDGTSKVVIKHEKDVLAERTRSPNTPTLNINPIKYLPDEKIELSWEATDKDGDKLFYDVFYSNDGGKNYVPLAVGLSQEKTSLSIDPKNLPGGKDSRILVDASDGFNEAEAKSEIFFVATTNKPPVAKIYRPYEGSEFIKGEDTILSGEAYNFGGEELRGDSLRWFSNIDGEMGKGDDLEAKLSKGEHIITLKAQDSEGNVATYSRNVKVTNDKRPDIPIYDIKFDTMKINEDGNVVEGRIYVELFNIRESALANMKIYVNGEELEVNLSAEIINNGKELWYIPENDFTSFWTEWRPPTSGKYNVKAVVSDTKPEESDITNNQKETTINVTGNELPSTID